MFSFKPLNKTGLNLQTNHPNQRSLPEYIPWWKPGWKLCFGRKEKTKALKKIKKTFQKRNENRQKFFPFTKIRVIIS